MSIPILIEDADNEVGREDVSVRSLSPRSKNTPKTTRRARVLVQVLPLPQDESEYRVSQPRRRGRPRKVLRVTDKTEEWDEGVEDIRRDREKNDEECNLKKRPWQQRMSTKNVNNIHR